MVVFTCQHCNESLKKPAVEKHYSFICRRSPYLTCVDCFVDFRGDEYVKHTSCISEDQRYGDKNFVPKAVAVKQNNWIDVVLECIKKNENPKFKPIMQRLSHHSNVPRKKSKFINFMKNGLNIPDETISGQIFDIFQYEFTKAKESKKKEEKPLPENTSETLNNTDKAEDKENKKKKKKDKKRNHVSESSDVLIKDEGLVNGDSESPAHVKKKKSKKQKLNDSQKEPLEEVDHVNLNDSVNSSEKKKKKKKSKDNKENLKETQVEQETDVSNLEDLDKSLVNTDTKNEKLSKKELKKLKKKQKYEAELKEIEENQNVPSDSEVKSEETQEDVPEKGKSKKHKKRKVTVSESEQDCAKKQKVEEVPEESRLDGRPEVPTVEPNPKAKFDWEEVIKEVLSKSSDHEMSMKRLSKKVLAEYQAVKGDRETFEQLMSKFNKKINKIPGVRILKDKAKLLANEE